MNHDIDECWEVGGGRQPRQCLGICSRCGSDLEIDCSALGIKIYGIIPKTIKTIKWCITKFKKYLHQNLIRKGE